MPRRYPEEGIVPAREIKESHTLPEMHFSSKMPLVDGVPLGSVKEDDLVPLRTRGYRCESTRSVFETDIARVLEGEIDLKKLAESRPRVKCCAEMVRHNKVLMKVVDRTHISAKFVTKILPQDLKAIGPLRYHPNIALMYDSFLSHTHVYLVSEYTAGVDISTHMARHRHNEDMARSVFGQIVSAFKYAHNREVTHRDLKPACITVNETGHVKISDFGLPPKLSIVKKAQLHETTKRAYMAPEIIKSRRYESKESDIYSMGIVLYEMLHGCLPYVGQKEEVLHQIRLRALKFYARVSQEAKVFIKKMVHPDPWKRPKIADCQSDPWSRGIKVYSPTPPKTPKPSYSRDPSPLCHRPGHNNQACTPATIKCGSEHVVLRSRLPRRNTACALDLNFPKMCPKLKPKHKISNTKEHTQNSTSPKVPSHGLKVPACKIKQTVSPIKKDFGKSMEQLDQGSSIESVLCVTSIPKPIAVTPADYKNEIKDFCSENVFSVNAATTEPSVSVMVFDHADSEYTWDESEYEPVAAVAEPAKSDTKCGEQKDIPPLVVNTPVSMKRSDISSPDLRSQPCSAFMANHPVYGIEDYDDISSDEGGKTLTNASVGHNSTTPEDVSDPQIVTENKDVESVDSIDAVSEIVKDDTQSEALTAASYKSERASPVPSDLGSMEPPYIHYRCHSFRSEDMVNLNECMQLPAVSTEEQVMQFLSTVPYNEKLSKSAPKRNLPAIMSAPKLNLPAIQPQQQERQYAQTQRKNLPRGITSQKPLLGSTKKPCLTLPRLNVDEAMTISSQKVCTEKPQQPDAALIEHNQRAQIEAEIEAKIKEILEAEAEELMVDQIVVSVPTEELHSQRSSSEVMVGLNEEFAEQVREVTPVVTVTPRSQGMTVCPQDDKPQEEKARSLEYSYSDSQICSSTNSLLNELKNSASDHDIYDDLARQPLAKRLTIGNLLDLSEPIPFRSQKSCCKNPLKKDIRVESFNKQHSHHLLFNHTIPGIGAKPANHSVPIIKGTTLNKTNQGAYLKMTQLKQHILPNRTALPKLAKHHAPVEKLKKDVIDLKLTVQKVSLNLNKGQKSYNCKIKDSVYPRRKLHLNLSDYTQNIYVG